MPLKLYECHDYASAANKPKLITLKDSLNCASN